MEIRVLIARIVLVFLSGILLLFLYYTFSQGTNVQYESSDGKWLGSESLFKNLDFKIVLFNFEKYKLRCNPEAKLYRVTKRDDATFIENIFNRYNKPKWQVPYRNPVLTRISVPECYKEAISAEERRLIEKRANLYLNSIRLQN